MTSRGPNPADAKLELLEIGLGLRMAECATAVALTAVGSTGRVETFAIFAAGALSTALAGFGGFLVFLVPIREER